MDHWPYHSLITGLLIIGLLVLNGIFTAIHTSLITINTSKLKEENNPNTNVDSILKILSDQDRLNQSFDIVNIVLSLFTIAYFAKRIREVNFIDPLSIKTITFIGIILYAILKVIFVDKIPQRIGVRFPMEITNLTLGLTRFILVITKPIVVFSTFVTNLFMKAFGIEAKKIQRAVTGEQIRSIIQIGEDQGILRKMESKMIYSIMGFDDLLAEEIMTARTDVFMIDINDRDREYLDEFMKIKHARIPVYQNEVDNILGIVYTKDYLLEATKVGIRNVDINKILRPAYFAPDKIEADKLFSDLQKNHIHMAVLIDEYGGFSGVVTVEDLIEEIVGDIDDSYDNDTPEIKENDKDVFVVKGSVAIKDLNEKINIDIDEDNENFDSLGGFIIDKLGYVPEEGSNVSFEHKGFEIKILYIEDKRIKAVRIRKIKNKREKINSEENQEKAVD
ncbi:MAG: hemolysin family protein [Anaerococcus sp.]|nr:hemolysin family protein [Anaerococcus sp.]MDD7045381.1 hemolysin family protein [Peptoniphilaceae bacterium]MDY2919116.1 hemolysin family protein [Anaerococcus sp.]